MKNNKRAMQGIGDLVPFAIMLGVAVLVISLMATLTTELQLNACDGSIANGTGSCVDANSSVLKAEYNITSDGLTGIQTLGSYLPTLALAGVIVLVIGFIITFVVRRFVGGR